MLARAIGDQDEQDDEELGRVELREQPRRPVAAVCSCYRAIQADFHALVASQGG